MFGQADTRESTTGACRRLSGWRPTPRPMSSVDVRQLVQVGDLLLFQTFLRLSAGRTGQLLNISSLASDSGISPPTARSWLSVLEASYIAFRLATVHSLT